MMVVTVEEVRTFLKNLPRSFVEDDTIDLQIKQAEWLAAKEKSSHASTEDIDKVVLARSAYFTTLAYMEEAERSLGVVPPGLQALVSELRTEMLQAMEYLKRGDHVSIPLTVSTISSSIWDYRRVDNP